jgi:hypothetical protein
MSNRRELIVDVNSVSSTEACVEFEAPTDIVNRDIEAFEVIYSEDVVLKSYFRLNCGKKVQL